MGSFPNSEGLTVGSLPITPSVHGDESRVPDYVDLQMAVSGYNQRALTERTRGLSFLPRTSRLKRPMMQT